MYYDPYVLGVRRNKAIQNGVYFALEKLGKKYLDLGRGLLPPSIPFDQLRDHRILLHLNPCLKLLELEMSDARRPSVSGSQKWSISRGPSVK